LKVEADKIFMNFIYGTGKEQKLTFATCQCTQ